MLQVGRGCTGLSSVHQGKGDVLAGSYWGMGTLGRLLHMSRVCSELSSASGGAASVHAAIAGGHKNLGNMQAGCF